MFLQHSNIWNGVGGQLHVRYTVCIHIPAQADKADQTGFDILLEKHLNGKNAIKEMAEFFRERCVECVYVHHIHWRLTLCVKTQGSPGGAVCQGFIKTLQVNFR